MLSQDTKTPANFIKYMNDLFDLMHSCNLNNFNTFMAVKRKSFFAGNVNAFR